MAFIVDGFAEKLILQRICPGKKVSRLDLNGKSVTPEAMAKKIASLIRVNGGKHYPTVVLVDKEKRSETADEFRVKLIEHLDAQGLENEDVRVGVADRMLENWVVADWNCLGCEEKRPDTVDGLNGAAVLKCLVGSFGKTTDVVDWFVKSKASTIRLHSPSFCCFERQISDLNCGFLDS